MLYAAFLALGVALQLVIAIGVILFILLITAIVAVAIVLRVRYGIKTPKEAAKKLSSRKQETSPAGDTGFFTSNLEFEQPDDTYDTYNYNEGFRADEEQQSGYPGTDLPAAHEGQGKGGNVDVWGNTDGDETKGGNIYVSDNNADGDPTKGGNVYVSDSAVRADEQSRASYQAPVTYVPFAVSEDE